MFDIFRAQAQIRAEGLEGWLIYDFRATNPLLALIAGRKIWTTRRLYLLIPAEGEPSLLVNRLDLPHTSDLPGKRLVYSNRFGLEDMLTNELLAGRSRLAMEYSPQGALPVVSVVDAGVVEMIRAKGIEVVSSADLSQVLLSTWDEQAMKNHAKASELVGQIKDEAFEFIGEQLKRGHQVSDYTVQQFIMSHFAAEGLETDDPPVVATNQRSGDPHYVPSAASSVPIKSGDWVLIDLWARIPGDANIFSDITWVGVAGRDPTDLEQRVFDTVKAGRDEAVSVLRQAWSEGRTMMGWEVDETVRRLIGKAGFGDFFFHRTGHSLSPGKFVHGTGVNLDNFETHDTRRILPGLGFTVEPGIYLDGFGVRLEINVLMTDNGPRVTSCLQDEIVRIH